MWKLHINAEKVSTDLILCPSHQSHTAIKHIYCAASIYGHTLPPMENQREGGAEFDVLTVKKSARWELRRTDRAFVCPAICRSLSVISLSKH